MAEFSTGDRVFFVHPVESWVLGKVADVTSQPKRSGGGVSYQYACTAETSQVPGGPRMPEERVSNLKDDQVHAIVSIGGQDDESKGEAGSATSVDPVHDLLSLSYLHDSTLLHQVRARYFTDTIYTWIGPIVLALNPYSYNLPNYTVNNMPKYLQEGDSVVRSRSVNMPHAWSTAHESYWLLRTGQGNQSVIVSGESGAGKTETAKIVLKYLAAVSTQECNAEEKEKADQVNKKVVQSSPILEAFGNAKTNRNDNSSRFGKFMKVHFAADIGTMVGAEIEVYLLEKSRIVTHAAGERCYHSFYQLLAGADQFQRASLHLESAKTYPNLNAGKAVVIQGVDDSSEFRDVVDAMEIVGFTKEEQDNVWQIVAGVLHALRIQFSAKTQDSSQLDPNCSQHNHLLEAISQLWGIEAQTMVDELLTTTSHIGSETFTKTLRLGQAVDVRDAMCKATYERLFIHIVGKINDACNSDPDATQAQDCWVGLLDIFGFEHFEVNSFEQMCINLANETLQNHYNAIIFTRDMEECREEGIDTESIVFYDNQPCLDMVCGFNFSALCKSASATHSKTAGGSPSMSPRASPRPSAKTPSLFSIIDEESKLGKGTDLSFLEKATERYESHANFIKPKTESDTFVIRHYAGDVKYSVEGFREKNSDTMKESIKVLLRGSGNRMLAELYPIEVEGKTRHSLSVSALYKQQLISLMTELNATHPHWIRCVKPHSAKKPKMFMGSEVMTQMRSAGVLETVRIRKMSFSMRFIFSDFCNFFRLLFTKEAWASKTSDKQACKDLLVKCKVDDGHQAQVGHSKVFLKTEAYYQVNQRHHLLKNRLVEVISANLTARAACFQVRIRQLNCYIKWIQGSLLFRPSMIVMRKHELKVREQYLLENFREIMILQSKEHAMRDVQLVETEAEEREALAARWCKVQLSNVEAQERSDRGKMMQSLYLDPLNQMRSVFLLEAEALSTHQAMVVEYRKDVNRLELETVELRETIRSLRAQELIRLLSRVQLEEAERREQDLVLPEDLLFVFVVRNQRVHLAEELNRGQHLEEEQQKREQLRSDAKISWANVEERWLFAKRQRFSSDLLQLRKDQHEARCNFVRTQEVELLQLMASLEIDFNEAVRKELRRQKRAEEKRRQEAEAMRQAEAKRAAEKLEQQREEAQAVWQRAVDERKELQRQEEAVNQEIQRRTAETAASVAYLKGFNPRATQPKTPRRGAFSTFGSQRSPTSPDSSLILGGASPISGCDGASPAPRSPSQDTSATRTRSMSHDQAPPAVRVGTSSVNAMEHLQRLRSQHRGPKQPTFNSARQKQEEEAEAKKLAAARSRSNDRRPMSAAEKHEQRRQQFISARFGLAPYGGTTQNNLSASSNVVAKLSGSSSPARKKIGPSSVISKGSINPFKQNWVPPSEDHVYLPDGSVVSLRDNKQQSPATAGGANHHREEIVMSEDEDLL